MKKSLVLSTANKTPTEGRIQPNKNIKNYNKTYGNKKKTRNVPKARTTTTTSTTTTTLSCLASALRIRKNTEK